LAGLSGPCWTSKHWWIYVARKEKSPAISWASGPLYLNSDELTAIWPISALSKERSMVGNGWS